MTLCMHADTMDMAMLETHFSAHFEVLILNFRKADSSKIIRSVQ